MSERNTVLRSLHDAGLAVWCGGALMGAVGLNGAAEEEGRDDVSSARIASTGWAKWTPVNAGAIGVHLIGALGLLAANSARVRYQKGVTASSVVKTALTLAALGVTAYTRVLGKKVELAASPDPEAREAAEEHPMELEQAQKQLAAAQWAVPALTTALVTVTALQGEQQRPGQQKKGLLRYALNTSDAAAKSTYNRLRTSATV
jgi:hypothetical protein